MVRAELPDVGLYGSMDRYGDLGIHAVIDLRRRFSRTELERAMRETIAAFPVLDRRYVPGFWRDRWQKVEGPLSESVHVRDEPVDLEAETASWARRPIDSTRERPLRLVSLGRAGGSRLIFSITHLAVDGGGAAAVGHVLGAHLYGLPPAAPVDARRSVASSLEGLRWHHAPVLLRDVARTMLLPLQTLAAARRERHFPVAASREPTWRHLTISAAEVEQIKLRCRPRGASVNDALIAALARIAAKRSSRGPLAVMYTMDLRRYAGSPRLTAANTSSILSVIVPREAVSDLAATAEAVARITSRHRQGLAGPAFILTPLALAAGAPHAWARRITRWLHPVLIELPLSRGLVFTNVGRIDAGLSAFGDDIESLRVIGPNVTGVRVPAVVAFGYRGELHLQLFGAPGLAALALDELEGELREALELTHRNGATDARSGVPGRHAP
ncbi:MAG: hypothetical protein HS104_29910 [Polyangiaceae bacterium]|nr:hypothetical protein [Polyangiaceae bacterium]MCE7888458.1 hypothetical protein [Sorangiineae bacterium PRO1]MCL4754652.1 hypothetical protein [Myxococcales bacterium]